MSGQRKSKKGFFTDTLRYVDDFKTELVTENGRTRKKTTYIGVWEVLREPGRGTLIRIIGSAVLAAIAAAAGIGVLLVPHGAAGSYFVLVPHLGCLFPLLYLAMGAFSLPYRQKPMRRDQYMHGPVRMQRSSIAVLAFTIVGAAASGIVRWIAQDGLILTGDVLYYAGCLAIALACGGILLLIGGIDIAEYPNSYVPQT